MNKDDWTLTEHRKVRNIVEQSLEAHRSDNPKSARLLMEKAQVSATLMVSEQLRRIAQALEG